MKIFFLWLSLCIAAFQPVVGAVTLFDDSGEETSTTYPLDTLILRCVHDRSHIIQGLLEYVVVGGLTPLIKTVDITLQTNLRDIMEGRLSKDLIMNCSNYVFSGTTAVFYNGLGKQPLQSTASVMTLFATNQAAFLRGTYYEMLEMFLDTVFGLRPGVDGVPPPRQRIGSLEILLKHKLDFIIGCERDGNGQHYGTSNTPNHFSDHTDSVGSVSGVGGGSAITLGTPLQKVTDFFDSYHAHTDYERLKALCDVLMTIKTSA